MATYLPAKGKSEKVDGPLTLTALQTRVKGFIQFVDLPSGDCLVINESQCSYVPVNDSATAMAGYPIRGDVILCTPEEIA